jgi:hypothetical protein
MYLLQQANTWPLTLRLIWAPPAAPSKGFFSSSLRVPVLLVLSSTPAIAAAAAAVNERLLLSQRTLSHTFKSNFAHTSAKHNDDDDKAMNLDPAKP